MSRRSANSSEQTGPTRASADACVVVSAESGGAKGNAEAPARGRLSLGVLAERTVQDQLVHHPCWNGPDRLGGVHLQQGRGAEERHRAPWSASLSLPDVAGRCVVRAGRPVRGPLVPTGHPPPRRGAASTRTRGGRTRRTFARGSLRGRRRAPTTRGLHSRLRDRSSTSTGNPGSTCFATTTPVGRTVSSPHPWTSRATPPSRGATARSRRDLLGLRDTT